MNTKFKSLTTAIIIVALLSGCEKQFTSKDSAAVHDAVGSLISDKPNIVMIVSDDIGYEIPTADGGRSYSTPNIDKIAKGGIRFTQVRAAPLCSPSRFMLFTGKYNFRNYGIWGIMDTTQRTIGNMLQDAGYTTCYAGKWQLDGGDNSIRKFGFDKYSVWLPFKVCPEETEGSRYKNPKIYQEGGYLPDSFTNGKYSDDIFTDYVGKFIDSNKAKPFFICYSMILGHKPYCPTPDDPEFATWDADPYHSDTTFYPSMVKYMDKKIGLIITKLFKLGLMNNTIVIYTGDNGTQKEITSKYKTTTIQGAKGKTIEYGIHVPLFCNWQGTIAAGSINGSIIDFTDFLPTLAGIANVPVPTAYGPLDGTSFYPQLVGLTGNIRSSMFTHFDPQNCTGNDKNARYAQDSMYKLYETGQFYNFKTDVFEKTPLADSSLSAKQKRIKRNLQAVITQMHN